MIIDVGTVRPDGSGVVYQCRLQESPKHWEYWDPSYREWILMPESWRERCRWSRMASERQHWDNE